MAIDVDDVATESDLDDYLGGMLTEQMHLLPKAWSDSEKVRQWALDETLRMLSRRVPPIYEEDITRPSELKQAVVHGAAFRLFEFGMSAATDAEVFNAKAVREEKRFYDEIDSLKITVEDGVTATAMSFGVSRR